MKERFTLYNIVTAFIKSFPYAIVFACLAQLISMGHIDIATYPRSFVISYFWGITCSAFVPIGKPAATLASRYYKPGTKGHYIVSNIIYELFFSIYMGITTGFTNGIISHMTIAEVLLFALKTLCFFWFIACIICACTNDALGKLSAKLFHKEYIKPY